MADSIIARARNADNPSHSRRPSIMMNISKQWTSSTQPKLIGISGKFGAGKDSIADVLCDHLGFIRFSFAGALRAECAHMIETGKCPDDAPAPAREIILSGRWQPGDVHLKPTPAEIRRLLQWWGEWRRSQNTDYWLPCMEALIEQIVAPIVIPDVRYENEAEFIRSRGGKVWLVERKDRAGYGDPALHSHISERFCEEYRDWDLRIANDGSLDDLEAKVLAILRCHREIERCEKDSMNPALSPSERLGATIGFSDWNVELRQIHGEVRELHQTQTRDTA